MPCRDYYDEHPGAYYAKTIEGLQKQVSFAESALCAALNALEHVDSLVETVSPKQGSFYEWINFKDAGIKQSQLVGWHLKHKEIDAKHRAEEAEKKRIADLKASAMSKLTEDEKKVLGVR